MDDVDTDAITATLNEIKILDVESLIRLLRSQWQEPVLKLRKLSQIFQKIDWDLESEVKEVVEILPENIVTGVYKFDTRNSDDVHAIMNLIRFTNEVADSEFNVTAKVMEELALALAISLDPRKYDSYRWHASDAALEEYTMDRVKMIRRAAKYIRPMINEVTERVDQCIDEFPTEEDMREIVVFMEKYDHLYCGWEMNEMKQKRWSRIRNIIEKIMRTKHAPLSHVEPVIQMTYWMIRLNGFEWIQQSYKLFNLIFTFNCVMIYSMLDKQDLTSIDTKQLEFNFYIIEQAIRWVSEESAKPEPCLSDDELIQLLKDLDKGHEYVCDYIQRCHESNIVMPKPVRLLVIEVYCAFAQYGNVEPIEKKYGEFLTPWLFTSAITMLKEADDYNVQRVVHCAEVIIVNASSLKTLNTDLGILLANYLEFTYDEDLKGVDIGFKETTHQCEELFTRKDWYTKESMNRIIKNLRTIRISHVADRLVKKMGAEQGTA